MNNRHLVTAAVLVICLVLMHTPIYAQESIRGQRVLIFNEDHYSRAISREDVKTPVKPQKIEKILGWQTIKYEDFEASFPNDWNVYAKSGSADAYWDDTSFKRYAGSWSCFCADLGAEAGGYGGQYVNNMNAWMIYGPFDLSDADHAEMTFYHWTKTQSSNDKFHFGASTDGSVFYVWDRSGNYTDDAGNVGGWLPETLNLADVYEIGDLTGESQVWVAFVFTSDGSVVDDGTYIDEVTIRKSDIPREPSNLEATPVSSSQIHLHWMDNSRTEAGFLVRRRNSGGGWDNVTNLAANVTFYEVNGLSPNTPYTYQIGAYNTGGEFTFSNEASATTLTQTEIPVKDPKTIPEAFDLLQNYPNPFNPYTEIRFDLPRADRVELSVYNLYGQKIRTLIDSEMNAGTHHAVWDGRDDKDDQVPTGIYIYRIVTDHFRAQKKMSLLK